MMVHNGESKSESHDLLPRTWRQWWIHKPSWFRIVVWGAAIFVAVHAALAVRIAIGLQESSVVTTFREQKTGIPVYFWQVTNERFWGEHWLSSGLWGRRPGFVTAVLFYRGGSDEDLQYASTHFPNLRHVVLNNAEVSSAGLRALQSCRDITFLDLTDTDVQDADLELLLSFSNLQTLSLSGTRITEAAIPLVRRLSRLQSLNVSCTAASLSIGPWPGHLKLLTTKTPRNTDLFASIRWADGNVCERFPVNAEVYLGPEGAQWHESSFESQRYDKTLARTVLCQHVGAILDMIAKDLQSAKELGEDISSVELSMTIKLGGYDSELVPIVVRGEKLPLRQIEFRMPVTRAEAMQSLTSNQVQLSE